MSLLHSCQHGLKKMRDVLLISMAFTLHLPHQHLDEPERGHRVDVHWSRSAKPKYTHFLIKNKYLIARRRYHLRFRIALSNKMSPFSDNYCDFQRVLLFRNEAGNAGRCQPSRTIAGRLTPMLLLPPCRAMVPSYQLTVSELPGKLLPVFVCEKSTVLVNPFSVASPAVGCKCPM